MSDPTNPNNPADPADPASYSGYADPADAAPTAPAWDPTLQQQQPQQPVYADPVYADPAYAYAAPGTPPAPAPVLLTMGDISVTQFHVITPNGTHSLEGTSWYVTDNSTYEQAVPQWAIICAIVGFFLVCFFSLLLLLVKETKASGSVQVTVQGPGWSHVTQLPPGSGAHANAQATYVRNLVAALPRVLSTTIARSPDGHLGGRLRIDRAG